MRKYIGLDVHCKKTTFVIQDEEGTVVRQGKFGTTIKEFKRLLASEDIPPGTSVGLETGTQTWWVARVLAGLGMGPVVIDAREVRAKARRIGQKSDMRDAFEVCDGLRRGIYSSLVYVPPAAIQRLRQILSRRRHFVKIRVMQINAAKFILRASGVKDVPAHLVTVGGWQKLLAGIEGGQLCDHVVLHAKMWGFAHSHVLELDRDLCKAARPFQEIVDLLRTAPWVGPITSTAFIAALGTPERFADSSRVVSYVGLAVRTWNSAETVRHGHITKMGASYLRSVLCEVAHHAADPRHPLNPYFARTCAKSGYRKAIVAVAQRLTRILYRMWRDNEAFDETKLNVIREKSVRKRTVYYRIKKPSQAAAAS